MPALQHVLFPIDFSAQSSVVAPLVSAIAERFAARITLLCVVPPFWNAAPEGLDIPLTVGELDVERDIRSRLETAAAEFRGIPIQCVTRSGDPAQTITEFAHGNAVDLIMMPTHGGRFFRSLLIGSVTAKVLHDVRSPVWTAAHAMDQRARGVPRNVLCTLDETPESVALLEWAGDFAQRMDAALKLVHVVPPLTHWITVPGQHDLQRQIVDQAHAKIESLRRDSSVRGTVRIVVGQVADAIAKEVGREAADLVIIGRGSLKSSLGRLRTQAYSVILKSPCPVISV
jgi:nucleotide-binding universal stress UspA family protein